jgi:uncharacterized membrane protein
MNISTVLDTKRIQALTDGTFSVAMTILILELKIPAGLPKNELPHYFLNSVCPGILIYMLSFVTLGIFWIGSHFHHHLIMYTDRISSWLNIFFLMMICIVPFSASFLNNYKHENLAIVVYSVNLIGVSTFHLFMLVYAWKKRYIKPHFTRRHYNNAIRRVLIPISMYSVTIVMAYTFPTIALYFLILPILLHLLPEKGNKTINKEYTLHSGKLHYMEFKYTRYDN